MRPEELRDILATRPFGPVRLTMSTGETVDITHPDATIIARTTVVVGIGFSPDHIADRTRWYNLLHIVKIETLGNGKRNGGGKRKSA